MRVYPVVEIIDAIFRWEDLDSMSLQSLCKEAGITYSLKQRERATNIKCDIIIEEYGHDMLVYLIQQMELASAVVHKYDPDPDGKQYCVGIEKGDIYYILLHDDYFYRIRGKKSQNVINPDPGVPPTPLFLVGSQGY